MVDQERKPLAGQVALVTGASRGIGKAIASSLADAGADVIAAATTEDSVRETVDSILGAGGTATGIAMDVSDDDSVAAALESIKEEHAKISILVNNAGVTRDTLLLRMKKEDWDFVIGTNLDGVYRLTRALAPVMIRARYGRIVNVTSVVGAIGNPGQGNYAASKAGIEGFTRSMARELASRNITVNCVAPGFIDTDMTRGLDEKAKEALLSQVPLERLGTAQDVANAVMFLLGEEASYITGSILHVNGGMYM
ncbi:MAG: 3-oxoacyl-ACP reductase FabG [Acidobacteria bacterium]|uniref:3-oxoacyl-[acyl-carrier-protein] reductase n=1 Tax=Candidatus Polarisedimenticola svalbardensis TaxID=2886004 RepID=A0A8J7C217_9BACT|nr:3-oxoacyl-ACP reductase FabG [Candidatus Polarisedimenticola svalbardensis]